MRSRYNYLNILIFIFLFIIFSFTGYFTGLKIGNDILRGVLTDSSRNSFLLFSPAYQYFEIYRLINSNREFNRLSGYYSLLENNMLDPDFLHERYQKEKSRLIKRTIIWIMGYSDNFEKVKDIYNKIYHGSKIEVKREILFSAKKRDSEYYYFLIKKFKIPGSLIDQIDN